MLAPEGLTPRRRAKWKKNYYKQKKRENERNKKATTRRAKKEKKTIKVRRKSGRTVRRVKKKVKVILDGVDSKVKDAVIRDLTNKNTEQGNGLYIDVLTF